MDAKRTMCFRGRVKPFLYMVLRNIEKVQSCIDGCSLRTLADANVRREHPSVEDVLAFIP